MVSNSDISILIIDDDPFMLDSSVQMLSRLGYDRVEVANNGSTALGLLITSNEPYSIIFCDLNMPEMDGVEFIRHASSSGYSGGLILISGEDSRILETAQGFAKAHELNVLGALTKPIDPDKILNLLEGFVAESKETRHYSPQKSITEMELKKGLKGSSSNEIMLVYQPKVNVKSGEIVGVETLARWWNEERGVLGPGAFIPLAEASGLIDELTNEIFRRAVIHSAEWAKQGRNLRTAVNFSVNSFAKTEFSDFLIDTMVRYELNPDQVVLEITETQAMTIAVDCLEALLRMRLKRFGLSIDDFGTGNSSLAQLMNIPFAEMKIDRAFVNGATNDPSALAILETSISLAKKLDMQIVAEGAETREDWDLVEKLGCDYVQGFYCAKPMRNEDLLKFLDTWTGPH